MDIFVESQFSGGHHLRDYPGKCEKPHGHNWKVKVTVRTSELDQLGMGIDFQRLKAETNSVLAGLDHSNLNEHPAFLEKNPSSEHIAIFIFQALKERLFSERTALYSVEVRETDTNGVIYYGEEC